MIINRNKAQRLNSLNGQCCKHQIITAHCSQNLKRKKKLLKYLDDKINAIHTVVNASRLTRMIPYPSR